MDRDTRLAIIVQTRARSANHQPPFTWARRCVVTAPRISLKSLSGQSRACSITSHSARPFYTFIYFRGESFRDDATYFNQIILFQPEPAWFFFTKAWILSMIRPLNPDLAKPILVALYLLTKVLDSGFSEMINQFKYVVKMIKLNQAETW